MTMFSTRLMTCSGVAWRMWQHLHRASYWLHPAAIRIIFFWIARSLEVHITMLSYQKLLFYIHFTDCIRVHLHVFNTQRVDRTLLCTISTLVLHSSALESIDAHSEFKSPQAIFSNRGLHIRSDAPSRSCSSLILGPCTSALRHSALVTTLSASPHFQDP